MQLSFVTALEMAEVVASVLPEGAFVNCKWPNDVLVGGRKVSGVLLESQALSVGNMDWLIIGVGLNIVSFPEDVEFPATSLVREGAKNITVERMLENFCVRFLASYVTWKKIGFQPTREAWLRRADWIGKKITVRLENETLRGEFKTLDRDGALILLYNGQERRITAGDIFV